MRTQEKCQTLRLSQQMYGYWVTEKNWAEEKNGSLKIRKRWRQRIFALRDVACKRLIALLAMLYSCIIVFKGGMVNLPVKRSDTMNIGNHISNIRKERQLTQEEFGRLFHVTRQTVSNWENAKSYPDLQILVDMSDRFEISLDTLLKEDSKMVKTIDKERVLGEAKKEKSITDFFTGAGTGLIASCLFSPHSTMRTAVIVVGLAMIGIGWYKKSKYDKRVLKYMEEHEEKGF